MTPVALTLEDSFVEQLAGRVVELLDERLETAASDDPWMDVDHAAEYLDSTRHRIHDLVSQGRLRYDGRDGRRGLFRRSTLDRYLESGGEGR